MPTIKFPNIQSHVYNNTHTNALYRQANYNNTITDAFLDEDFLQTIYGSERQSFDCFLAEFAQSPSEPSTFLEESCVSIKNLCKIGIKLHVWWLLKIQDTEFIKLGHITHDVHCEIAISMLQFTGIDIDKPSEVNNIGIDNKQDIDVHLWHVLIPKWRKNLDDCVNSINALVWLDKEARQGTPFEKEHREHMMDRKQRIQQMVMFALKCLQLTKEEIEIEISVFE